MKRDDLLLLTAVAMLAFAATNVALGLLSRPSEVEIVTPYGTMRAVLFDETPQHRDNFLKLAREGFYDSTTFHRIIPTFMVQGGDPYTKDLSMPSDSFGMGGPGYTVPAEIVPGLWHFKGALCAARMPDHLNPEKRSSGSQFYVVDGRPMDRVGIVESGRGKNISYTDAAVRQYVKWGGTPFLDGDYTVFGQVYDGLEVASAIARSPRMGEGPKTPIRMSVREVPTGRAGLLAALGLGTLALFALVYWAAGKLPEPRTGAVHAPPNAERSPKPKTGKK
jgi:cyclophilin family peptidyl-prolyl cis-trans isomerase